MTKLIITRGLPASGKTTHARAWVATDPVRRARVNRDDFRAMAHDSVFVKQTNAMDGTERAVQAARDATITALLKRGIDVICDDTNLPQRVARDLRRLAVLAGAEFEVVDLTNISPEDCVARDAARARPVGDEVIRDMHARYVAGKPYPLPHPEEPADQGTQALPYVAKPETPRAIMVDIDGTIALMCGRSPFDETRVHEDRPNHAVIQAVLTMRDAGHHVVFCSGRTTACRPATLQWLRAHLGIEDPELHMRPAGDARKDSIVKLELFDQHIRDRYDVRVVFDDRAQVVAAWRSIGLTCFQVAEGDF